MSSTTLFLSMLQVVNPLASIQKAWNIATDLAINSHLVGELPEMCCMPGQMPFQDYEIGLSAEAYLEQLKQDHEEGGLAVVKVTKVMVSLTPTRAGMR